MLFERRLEDTESVFDSVRACVTVRFEFTMIRLIQTVKGLLPKKNEKNPLGCGSRNDARDTKRRRHRADYVIGTDDATYSIIGCGSGESNKREI
jgi:hypothetical protein